MKALIVDIGGTKTSFSILEQKESKPIIINSEIIQTTSNPEHTIQKISSFYSSSKETADFISLSLPGKWSNEGRLIESVNLKNWADYPFLEKLKSETKIKNSRVETDVICGGLGEYFYNYSTYGSLLYINLGTGTGASFIQEGKPFKSKKDLTLRLHKMALPYENEILSATDLLNGNSLIQDTPYKSTIELFNQYKEANIEVIDIVSKAQTQLACWIINLYYLFAPEVIVLNGGLTYDFEVLCEESIDIANEELNGKVKIIPSTLKEMAPVYGAFYNIKNS